MSVLMATPFSTVDPQGVRIGERLVRPVDLDARTTSYDTCLEANLKPRRTLRTERPAVSPGGPRRARTPGGRRRCTRPPPDPASRTAPIRRAGSARPGRGPPPVARPRGPRRGF